jgi:thymidylate synthase (FAD)
MKLLFVRHGLSEGHFSNDQELDFERTLTSEGRKALHRSFKSLKRIRPQLDVIFTSPLARAVETAEILWEHNQDADLELMSEWNKRQLSLIEKTSDVYDWAIRNGIAKEQARAVLPEGLTRSRMYMNGTLRSWFHYCELRMENGTQKEHRLVAESAWNELSVYFKFLTEK